MEIARLIRMHKNLCIQMGAVANDSSKRDKEYYKLEAKVELLDDIIAEELHGVKHIEIDLSLLPNITYELYDTLGLQLQCEFKGNIMIREAEKQAFKRMEELNIPEAQLVMLYGGKIKAKKLLTIK